MPCSITLTLTEAAAADQPPLDEAVYVPTIDAIIGVMGPYVVRCNAETGAVETAQRFFQPGYGPCRICYHAPTEKVYVSIRHTQENQQQTHEAYHYERGVYEVDPATLVATDLHVLQTKYWGDADWATGVTALKSYGEYIYFMLLGGGQNAPLWIGRFNPGNIAGGQMGGGASEFWAEQFAVDTSGFYWAEARYYEMDMATHDGLWFQYSDYDYVQWSVPDRGVLMITAVEYATVSGRAYGVGGNQWMARIDNWTAPRVYTKLNLGAVEAEANPFRLRYRSSDSKLYIPCQQANAIIVWDPATDDSADAVLKTGFEYPFDVVFTPTKAFALQSGTGGLKEIV